MYKTLEDVMNELTPERRARIEERGRELIREEMTLQALRKQLEITQESMAERLDVRQGNVSRFENRSDMLISTLRDYLEAMGGRLELVAHLPGRAPITIEGLAGDSLVDG
ncbi:MULTISPECIES: helix-turn-helix domain-containing protein [Pseudomonas]|uniref:Helix-turn-helix domain-containing protein n=1 Tax=Pseudomonas mosselii TaxID=78327 RepID=A0AA42S1E3_9PSED|nr:MULTISPECIES: XRE family transcriptional regulator [Pseudomonas]MDC0688049.1 XRE family transcriptional regulator [Mitsuaria sp. RG]MCE0914765.1 helix-turn-helix domain-containing protein [Pseudomonas sp. NMI760_13]MCF1486159.1 helix-turn-helix domain-containing protein [Pseudomonas sp. AA27]MCP8634399.1 helix-turn-helix domain-containing protein [Pseudomonas sp. DVZ6]MDD7784556.1 XRE family transcriptional regulator [Pseudomonas sp. DVZ24]